MKAYFISGLGADKKAFYKLNLPAGYEPVYLDWITPYQHESLKEYAARFSELIREGDFVLIGLSLGGMIASEIARLKSPRKLILLSSISVSDEMPWYFRVGGKIGVQKAIPVFVYKNMTVLNLFMGAGSRSDKAMLLSFVKKTDASFIRWAVNAILGWNQRERLSDIVHIHGDKDRLLPVRFIRASHTVKEGRHLMVLTKAAEINRILRDVLSAEQIS
jgi:pimeloyl-ACP methyl ester carboxylesterase